MSKKNPHVMWKVDPIHPDGVEAICGCRKRFLGKDHPEAFHLISDHIRIKDPASFRIMVRDGWFKKHTCEICRTDGVLEGVA